jgi:hypothetical protein
VKPTGEISSAAFKSLRTSLFITERLSDQTGAMLQVGPFAAHARATLTVREILVVAYVSNGETVKNGFDIQMTPEECADVFAHSREAHATLLPDHLTGAAASAMARQFSMLGTLTA